MIKHLKPHRLALAMWLFIMGATLSFIPFPTFTSAKTPVKSVVIVDPTVEGYQDLMQGELEGVEYRVLNLDAGGIEQITQILGSYKNLESLQILSHGKRGNLYIGSTAVGISGLKSQQNQLKSWKKSFASGADILIYGCDVAQGKQGEKWVDTLSEMTGTHVAASKNKTGALSLQGDWNLEYTTGPIEAKLAINPQQRNAYRGILAPVLEDYTAHGFAGGVALFDGAPSTLGFFTYTPLGGNWDGLPAGTCATATPCLSPTPSPASPAVLTIQSASGARFQTTSITVDSGIAMVIRVEGFRNTALVASTTCNATGLNLVPCDLFLGGAGLVNVDELRITYVSGGGAADLTGLGLTRINYDTVPLAPVVLIGGISGPTTEVGGAANFGVSLNQKPTANVTIGLSSSDTTEGSVSPASLTFTPTNWSAAQTVTVTGVDDLVADGNQGYSIITAAATSTDPGYSGLNVANISVLNNDDETAANQKIPILVSPANQATVGSPATLKWKVTLDTGFKLHDYQINICTSATFTGCTAITIASKGSFPEELFWGNVAFANDGDASNNISVQKTLLLILLLFSTLGLSLLLPSGKRKLYIVLILLAFGFASCKKGSSDEQEYVYDSGVSGTTYYWKVTSINTRNTSTDSETRQFTVL